MKNKIIDGIATGFKFLLNVLGVALGVVVILAYHFGIPYIMYKFLNTDNSSYATSLAIWLGINLVMELWNRRKLKKQLKQYKEIDDIMKGRF